MKSFLVSAICIFAILVASSIGLHLYLIDGLDGLMLGMLFKEDTVYASGYSDGGFRSVRLGMSVNEVHRLLGPPLDNWERDGIHGERWTKSAHDSHYRCRVVLFQNAKVTEKHAEFYVD